MLLVIVSDWPEEGFGSVIALDIQIASSVLVF